MAISPYLRELRTKVGTDLLLMPSVTAVVWNDKGQLLLLRQPDMESWNVPGGIVDPGEHPAQALVREVREETGIIVRVRSVLGVFGGPDGFRKTYPNGDEVEFVDIVFDCGEVGGTLECADGEALEAKYFDVSELERLTIDYPINLEVLIRLSGGPMFCWNETWLKDSIGPKDI